MIPVAKGAGSGGSFLACSNASQYAAICNSPMHGHAEDNHIHSALEDIHAEPRPKPDPTAVLVDQTSRDTRTVITEFMSLKEHVAAGGLFLAQDDSSVSSSDLEFQSPERSESDSIHTISSSEAEDYPSCQGEKAGSHVQKLSASEIVQRLKIHPLYRNDYFEIRQSVVAGLGAIAAQELHEGDIILVEEPLFMSDNNHLFDNFRELNADAQSVALSLHKNEHLKEYTPDAKAVWTTNCFATSSGLAGIFVVAGRFNHACHPVHNIDFTFDLERQCLVLKVRAQKIPSGTELTICYGRELSPLILYYRYGFRCSCGGCTGISDEEVAGLMESW